MMKSGCKPHKVNHKNYGYFQTFGETIPPSFPDSYTTDAGLWMPNQDLPQVTQQFDVPALPEGCTDYTTADVGADLIAVLENPESVDDITNANAEGGTSVQTALQAGTSIGFFNSYFQVQPISLDAFDSVRLAMLSGVPEKRSVSVGSKWFPEFEQVDSTGILPTPNWDSVDFTWHNHKIGKFLSINGVQYLGSKSWQGSNYGDNGWCYFSRPLFNSLMAISGSVMFTVTHGAPPPPQAISVTMLEWVESNFRLLMGYFY